MVRHGHLHRSGHLRRQAAAVSDRSRVQRASAVAARWSAPSPPPQAGSTLLVRPMAGSFLPGAVPARRPAAVPQPVTPERLALVQALT